EAARQMRGANCRAKAIFLTMHREVTYAARCLEVGASGFVLKHSAASELVTAIQEVLKAGTYITPQVAGDLLGAFPHGAPAGGDGVGERLARRRSVFEPVVEGHSGRQTAPLLGTSRRTAEFHKARLMEVLGLQSTAELVQSAIRTGLSPV